MLERTGDKDELAALLSRQIDAAKDRGDAPSIASLALRLGQLLEQRDRSEARSVYYTGLDWDPASRPLLDALLGLLDGDDDATERADVTERRLAVEQGPNAEAMALALWQTRMDMGDETAAERALETRIPRVSVERDAARAARGALPGPQRLGEARRTACPRRERAPGPRGTPHAAARGSEPLANRARRSALRGEGARARAGDARRTIRRSSTSTSTPWSRPAIRPPRPRRWVSRSSSRTQTRRAVPLCWGRARASARSMGEGDGAREDLEAAFALEPEPYASALGARLEVACEAASDAASVRDLRLRQAHVLPYAGESERARTILAELVKQDPKDREALETLANLEVALERWDAASATLRRLVGVVEGDAAIDAALRLADACERAGRPGDARGALERARAASPRHAGIDRTAREDSTSSPARGASWPTWRCRTPRRAAMWPSGSRDSSARAAFSSSTPANRRRPSTRSTRRALFAPPIRTASASSRTRC